jgi:hypothetical protein
MSISWVTILVYKCFNYIQFNHFRSVVWIGPCSSKNQNYYIVLLVFIIAACSMLQQAMSGSHSTI